MLYEAAQPTMNRGAANGSLESLNPVNPGSSIGFADSGQALSVFSSEAYLRHHGGQPPLGATKFRAVAASSHDVRGASIAKTLTPTEAAAEAGRQLLAALKVNGAAPAPAQANLGWNQGQRRSQARETGPTKQDALAWLGPDPDERARSQAPEETPEGVCLEEEIGQKMEAMAGFVDSLLDDGDGHNAPENSAGRPLGSSYTDYTSEMGVLNQEAAYMGYDMGYMGSYMGSEADYIGAAGDETQRWTAAQDGGEYHHGIPHPSLNWEPPSASKTFQIVNPLTGKVMG